MLVVAVMMLVLVMVISILIITIVFFANDATVLNSHIQVVLRNEQ